MKLIGNLEWRYATKKFDPSKKVAAKELDTIKRAIQLSVSSYGLQLYKVLIIKDKNLRERLKPASWNQDQITDASHLFVFCNYTEVKPTDIDDYLSLTATIRQLKKEKLEGYGNFVKLKLAEKSKTEQFHWTKHQVYIALANLLAVCAELEIDACPMEGFESDIYNEILGLEAKGLNASVIATVGYRSEDDLTQYSTKVRKPTGVLFEEI